MIFLTEVMDLSEIASYATFELDEATIDLIRAGQAAFQALKANPKMDPIALHLDCGVEVQFWEECDFGQEEGDEKAAEKMKEVRYAVVSKVPSDLEDQEDIFADGVALVVGDNVFHFIGYGDDGIMETVSIPYSVLPEEKKEEAA
jgi:hypothetical protein